MFTTIVASMRLLFLLVGSAINVVIAPQGVELFEVQENFYIAMEKFAVGNLLFGGTVGIKQ